MSDATTMSELLARLDALAARVEEQDAEIRRLKATAATEVDASPISRRDLLWKGTLGLAVAALVSKPERARADTRTTIEGAPTGTYGAAVSPAGFAADSQIPTPLPTNMGLVAGTTATAPVATVQSAIAGMGSGARGVQGFSNSNYGVYGQSNSASGVRGEIPSTSGSNAIAVYGANNSSYAGPGPGAGGFGVYGLSAKGHGLVGATASAGGAAVVGATNGVVGAYAGAFYGPVIIGGDFTVIGGAKSAAVAHPDGSHRRLYCIESPESWFEDFGTGTLQCGRAEIPFDPDFAATVNTEDYHVFLTTYDNDHVLRVTNRTPGSFTVQADVQLAELKGQREDALSGTFGWRVVAKRRDIKGERLERVAVPAHPTLPSADQVFGQD